MTNKRKFIYNGILLTVVGLVIRAVGLAFSAFLGRTVGAEALGLYTLIGTLYSFAITFASSGVSLTVTRLVAGAVGEGRREEVGRIVLGACLYAILFSGTASLAVFFGAERFAVSLLGDARAERPLRILALSLIPIALSSVLSGYFIGVKRIKRSSAHQVISQFARIALTVFLITRSIGKGVESAVIALCISTSAAELVSFLFALFEYLLGAEGMAGQRRHFRSVFRSALPLALSSYVRSALLTLEHVLIPRRLGEYGEDESTALSSYGRLHGMALPVILFPMSPLTSFSSLLVPEFSETLARGDSLRIRRISSEVASSALSYAIPVSVLIYFFSSELGYLLYSSAEAGRYIAYLAPVIPIMYLDHVTDSMLKGIGEHVYSMWVNISDSLLSVILIWLLIPRLGILGYGLVIIIMEAYNFILSFVRLRMKTGIGINLISSVVKPLFASLTAAYLSDRLFAFGGAGCSVLWLALKLVFAACIYVAAMLSVGLLLSYRKDKSSASC